MRKTPWISLLVLSFLLGCTYTQKIKDGRMAFDRMQYSVAAGMLQKEYAKSKSRVEKGKLAFLLAESYRHLNRSADAIQWYQTAYDNQYGVDALREYAFSLKRAERYEEAKEAFKNLGIEIGSPYEYRREITACDIALGWQKEKRKEYEIELLPINSSDADYSPVLYKDRQLVFTSDRTTATGKELYNWTGNKFSDLFVADLNSNTVELFGPPLNTPFNEGTAVFSRDYSEVYFSRCSGGRKEGDYYCKLMMSRAAGNSWSEPEVLPFVQEAVNYVQPSLSADGKSLYFSANSPDGWGGYDLFVSERTAEGWGEPKLLGRTINTIGDEKFPYIDGDTLYFASDFHPGMGGLDVFRSYKLPNDTWTPAYNMKTPINSGSDDFGLIIDYEAAANSEILQTGYLTSKREDGRGNDDIFRFTKRVLPPEPVVDTPTATTPVVIYKMILEGYVLEKIYEDPNNPSSKILGRKPLGNSKVDITFGKETKSLQLGEDGYFKIELNENTDYRFLATHENYLNNQTTFTTKGIGKDPSNPVQTFEVEIVLDKIFKGREIVLENIYYDYDKWDIREDAKPTLNALADNLQLNPDIRIQLSSHTDCRGNDRYNEDLSQKRAQSAVDYLISQGIAAERLSAKGYGEGVPAVNCLCARCTEEEHQSNRRTAFTILE